MVKTVGIDRLVSTITTPSGAVAVCPTLTKDSYIFRLLQRLHSNVMGMSSGASTANNTPQKGAATPVAPAVKQQSPGSATKAATPKQRPAGAKVQRTPPPTDPAAAAASVPAASATGSDGDLMARFAKLKKKA